jgi:uncharacterized SAM-binding protein YcdF (DUF218 family)
MPRMRSPLLAFSAVAASAFVGGFCLFANHVGTSVAATSVPADAVVVLTGGEDRIAAGLQLIETRHGRRLLVSGVNRTIGSPLDLSRKIGGNAAIYKCCVDIGHDALDTIGNADEARTWAEAKRFRSLIVVTSAYHMPRSLIEFAIAMPTVRLIPHAVPSRHYHLADWWRHPATIRMLIGEYSKYLLSLARLAVARAKARIDGSRTGLPA